MSEKIYGQFDLETIEKLADIVKNKDLGEITIADGDKVITVKGKKCPPPAPMGMPMPMGCRHSFTCYPDRTRSVGNISAGNRRQGS